MKRAILFALFAAIGLWAQSTSQINGTVTDSSGASVPGTKITVTDEGTGAQVNETTNEKGAYGFSALSTGTFTVTAERGGFTTGKTVGVVVDVAQTRVVDFTLQPGATSTVVEVSATEQQVDTESAVMASTVDEKQLDDVMVNGRSFQTMLELIPGSTGSGGSGTGFSGAVNGVSSANYFNTIDGASNTNIGGTAYGPQVDVSIDAIGEMRVLTSSYLPELGGRAGAQINLTIKSGTKEVHGSFFEYVRNSITDSRTALPVISAVPPLKFNDWGGTFGAPAWYIFPKKWNLKDKLFFFESEERKTNITYTVENSTLPTAAMLSGNFQGSFLGSPIIAPDELTGPGGTGTYGTKNPIPFPNAIIPPSMFSINGVKMLAPYELPNVTASGYNYTFLAPGRTYSTTSVGKIDFLPNSHRRISYTDTYDTNDRSEGAGSFLDKNTNSVVTQTRPRPGYTVRLADTETLSATLLFTAAISITHSITNTLPLAICASELQLTIPELFPASYQPPTCPKLYNVPGINPPTGYGLAPNLSIQNFTGYSNNGTNEDLAYGGGSINFDMTKVRGAHTIKFGTLITRHRRNDKYFGFGSSPAEIDGAFSFTNVNSVDTSGNAVADTLLGNFASDGESEYKVNQFVRQWQSEFYIQDSWNVNRRLHIDYGVRFAHIPMYHFNQQNFDDFVPSDYTLANAPKISTTTGQLVPNTGLTFNGEPLDGIVLWGSAWPSNFKAPVNPYDVPVVDALFKNIPSNGSATDNSNFGPRIGIAYDPFGDGKTSIRAGFGMFFNRFSSDAVTQDGGGVADPPFQAATTLNTGNIDNPTGGSVTPNSPINFNGYAEGLIRTPRVLSYNLTVQRQLPFKLILESGFVGNLQRNLTLDYNINAFEPGTKFANPTISSAGSASLRPYLGWGTIGENINEGNGYYNSMLNTVSRRVGKGLSFSASFVWARGMAQAFQQNVYLPTIYTPSGNFNKLALTSNMQYRLPDLKSSGLLVRRVAGGWTLSTLLQARDGATGTISINGDPLGIYASSTLANLTCNPNNPPNRSTAEWFNTACVSTAVPTQLTGSAQYVGGVYRQPGMLEWDQSLFKLFPLGKEGKRTIEFRAECYNLPNHPSWGAPGTNVSTPTTFGIITSQANSNRVFDFNVKIKY